MSAATPSAACKVHVNVGALPKKKRHCFESGSLQPLILACASKGFTVNVTHSCQVAEQGNASAFPAIPAAETQLERFCEPRNICRLLKPVAKDLVRGAFPNHEQNKHHQCDTRRLVIDSIFVTSFGVRISSFCRRGPKTSSDLGISSPNPPRWLAVQHGSCSLSMVRFCLSK